MIRHYKKALQTKQAWRAFSLSGSRVALLVDCDFRQSRSGFSRCVSIHALRVECDSPARNNHVQTLRFNPRTPCGVRQPEQPPYQTRLEFQSTHSVWSATSSLTPLICLMEVSIHALRVECDPNAIAASAARKSFNPRTPCGVRRCLPSICTCLPEFQSTHSVWSATRHRVSVHDHGAVSIHALRVECDVGKLRRK